MRAWRRGCGWLEPWFRATPFAAAHHYRQRALRVAAAPSTADGEALARVLGMPGAGTLWVFDLPGPLAITLAWALRRAWRMSAALAWNGWYDPDGVLDGRAQIPLLLRLGETLIDAPDGAIACLVFDRLRNTGQASPERLDNRYTVGDEDMPAIAQARAAGVERVRVLSSGDLAPDVAEYVSYLRSGMPVEVITDVEVVAAA
jgi:hypothetical protein